MRDRIARVALLGLVVGATLAGATPRTVTKTTDSNDGVCDADCSLREAVAVSVAGDTVDFALGGSPPWIVRLTLGQISITHELTITGPGSSDLAISADSDSNGTGNSRVFSIFSPGVVALSDLTVRDGLTTSFSDKDGGCAFVSGLVELDSVVFTNCRAWNGTSSNNNSPGGEGGAIYLVGGSTLSVTDSSFAANFAGQGASAPDFQSAAAGGRGGALFLAGAATIRRTTFTGNVAGLGGQPNGHGGAGGAISVVGIGSLLLEDSTLTGNHSGDGNDLGFVEGMDGAGGALGLEASATLNNVTISGNFIGSDANKGRASFGGGIAASGGTTRLRNVTITGNSSNGQGGGLAHFGGVVKFRNSIFSGNVSSGTTNEDCLTNAAASFQSEGHDFFGVSTGCAASLVGTDQVGAALLLGALASNGGPTQTHALGAASAAIDAGDPAGCEAWDPSIPGDVALGFDQRGVARPIDGDGDLTAACDAGAFEAPEPPKFELSVAVDGSGAGSVTSDPAGIDCPDDCSEEYFGTQQVELAPDAEAGSIFTGWSGACTGTGACAPTMSTDRNVTATFALLRSLTVALAGEGGGTVTSDPDGIDCGLDCDHQYADGASVGLVAEPNVLSLFAGWSGDCTGGSCELTMSAARSVTATFLPLLIFKSDFESGFDGWSDVVGD